MGKPMRTVVRFSFFTAGEEKLAKAISLFGDVGKAAKNTKNSGSDLGDGIKKGADSIVKALDVLRSRMNALKLDSGVFNGQIQDIDKAEARVKEFSSVISILEKQTKALSSKRADILIKGGSESDVLKVTTALVNLTSQLEAVKAKSNELNAITKEMKNGSKSADDFTSSVKRLDAALDGMKGSSNEVKKMGDELDKSATPAKKLTSSIGGIERAARMAASAVAGFGTALGVASIAKAGVDMQRIERIMDYTFGGPAAKQAIQFAKDLSNQYGAEFSVIAERYAKMGASYKQAGEPMEDLRHVIESVTKATTVLGSSAAETDGIFLALQQMLSKGKVSAEELRGQLGERLTGAFETAAKAAGLTTAELDKMLQEGRVNSIPFLREFAKVLDSEFSEGAVKASDSASAAFRRLENAVFELKVNAAEGGILDALTSAAKSLATVFKDPEFVGGIQSIAAAIGGLLKYLAENIDTVLAFAKAALVIKGALSGAAAGSMFGGAFGAVGGAVVGGVGAYAGLDYLSGKAKENITAKEVKDREKAVDANIALMAKIRDAQTKLKSLKQEQPDGKRTANDIEADIATTTERIKALQGNLKEVASTMQYDTAKAAIGGLGSQLRQLRDEMAAVDKDFTLTPWQAKDKKLALTKRVEELNKEIQRNQKIVDDFDKKPKAIGSDKPLIGVKEEKVKKQGEDPAENYIQKLQRDLIKLDFEVSQFEKLGERAQSSAYELAKFETSKGDLKGASDAQKAQVLRLAAQVAAQSQEKADQLAELQYRKKTESIKADTAAMGANNLAKRNSADLADLVASGIGKETQRFKELWDARQSANFAGVRAEENVALQEFIASSNQSTDAIYDEIKAMGMSGVEFQIYTMNRDLDNQVREKSKSLTQEGIDDLIRETEALKQRNAAAIRSREDANRDPMTALTKSVDDYVLSAGNAATAVNTLFATTTDGLNNSLTNLFSTGKFGFADFTKSILEQMLKIIVQMQIVIPLLQVFKGLIGGVGGGGAGNYVSGSANYVSSGLDGIGGDMPAFANGGIMTSSGVLPLTAYSNGGVANKPQLALFGEGRMNEAYVPLPDGRTIPVTMTGANQSGGATNVVVNVNMNSGSDESKSDKNDGVKLGKAIATAVKQQIIEEKRPGGLLA